MCRECNGWKDGVKSCVYVCMCVCGFTGFALLGLLCDNYELNW